MNDIVTKIMDFEAGEMEETEIVTFFCDLANTGILNTLQGTYQRAFFSLWNAGAIMRDEETGVFSAGDEIVTLAEAWE